MSDSDSTRYVAGICSNLEWKISGLVRDTCHSSNTLSKSRKYPSPNIVAQSPIEASSVLEFPKLTLFRHV